MKPFQVLREIKSVSFATVSGGQPPARIIDVMLVQDEKIYFLTARGKPFYRQLLDGGRDILEAFCIYSGVGEIFDLGTHPPYRSRFAFGGAAVQPPGLSNHRQVHRLRIVPARLSHRRNFWRRDLPDRRGALSGVREMPGGLSGRGDRSGGRPVASESVGTIIMGSDREG